MLTRAGLVLVSAATVVSVGAAAAQVPPREAKGQHTAVELIAAAEGFDRSGELWVGLRFRNDPDWHIYWQNPGDSGGPPTVTWRLPQAVAAGDIVWPTPERITLGTIVNYGYYGDVVLPVRLEGPAGKPASGIIGADLKWLVCHDICVPGRASLGLSLPLAEGQRLLVAGWKQRIDQARAREPKAAPAAWRAEARSVGDDFVVRIETDRAAGPAVFFPLEAGLVNESAPQGVKAEGRALEFRLRKSDQLLSEPKDLKGVVALESGASFVVTAPVRQAARSSGGEE